MTTTKRILDHQKQTRRHLQQTEEAVIRYMTRVQSKVRLLQKPAEQIEREFTNERKEKKTFRRYH